MTFLLWKGKKKTILEKMVKNKIALTEYPAWHSVTTYTGRMGWKEAQEVEDEPPSTLIPPL